MSLSMEEQFRNQIEAELKTKQEQLQTAETELTNAQEAVQTLGPQVDQLKTKLARFDEVFGPNAIVVDTKRKATPVKKKETGTVNNSRAAQGRREVAEGKRPKIKDAMIQIMGTNIMNASVIYEGLATKGWLPNSNDPRAYIAYLLSSLEDFERVEGRGRGYYRVRIVSNGTSPVLSETDEILRDAGVLPAN